tara:strand:- start:402 stop:578 length:177 start_codon:yes stop_codon:yes gene_type:complete
MNDKEKLRKLEEDIDTIINILESILREHLKGSFGAKNVVISAESQLEMLRDIKKTFED